VVPHEPESVTVIYPGRWMWLPIGLFFAFVGLLGLSGAIAEPGLGSHLVLSLCTVFFGLLAFLALRQVLRPRPVIRLDQEGAECARGRVLWSDVHAIQSEERGWGDFPQHVVRFILRPGSTVLPPRRKYFTPWIFRDPVHRLRARLSPAYKLRSSGKLEVVFGQFDYKQAVKAARDLKAEHSTMTANSQSKLRA
jgi:hypothetical protein